MDEETKRTIAELRKEVADLKRQHPKPQSPRSFVQSLIGNAPPKLDLGEFVEPEVREAQEEEKLAAQTIREFGGEPGRWTINQFHNARLSLDWESDRLRARLDAAADREAAESKGERR